jgi:hypothetical protein
MVEIFSPSEDNMDELNAHYDLSKSLEEKLRKAKMTLDAEKDLVEQERQAARGTRAEDYLKRILIHYK